MLIAQSCLTLFDPMDCRPPTRHLHPWDSPGKNTGVGSHSLLQGIFLTQRLNRCLLHCQWILYKCDPPGKPINGNGYPLQYSCLEDPMDRGAWWATVHRIAESDMTEVT